MRLRNTLFTIFALFLPLLASLSVASVAYAQVDISSDVCDGLGGSGEVPTICGDIEAGKTTNVIYGKDGILTRAINLLSLVTGVAAVVVIIIAGISMTLSRADPGKISQSRSQIIYASVGLVVAVLAQAIVQLILNRIS